MRITALGVSLFAALLLQGCDEPSFEVAPVSERAEPCRVTYVVDGDTVDATCPTGRSGRIRLMGFDTPEVFSPRCAAELARGRAATAELRRIYRGARVASFEFRGHDRYGRYLAHAYADDEPVAAHMIAAGLARPYTGGRRGNWCN